MANVSDEDDAIVEEMPIYLSKTLKDNLFLLQYPTKITAFDNSSIMNCCVRPISNDIKIDFAIETQTECFDNFKAQNLASLADGKSTVKIEHPTYQNGIMDKLSYASDPGVSDMKKNLVGILLDKELHLTPLKNIIQLRPTFVQYDKEDQRKKAELKELAESDDDDVLQPVTVRFARPTGTLKRIREKPTFDSYMKQRNAEPWCESTWHRDTSPIAEIERQRLFCTTQHISNSFLEPPEMYLEKLKKSGESCGGIETVLPPRVMNFKRLRPSPILDQIKHVLAEGKMFSFKHLLELIKKELCPTIEASRLMHYLPQIATLLHGNWLLNSELLYLPNTLSKINGVSSELMVRAREYTIYKFARTPFIYRPQFVAAVQLPCEEAMQVLTSVARLGDDKKWVLLTQPDMDFQNRYPDLVRRQEMIWQSTESMFAEMDSEKSPKRIRKRSLRDSKSSILATGAAGLNAL